MRNIDTRYPASLVAVALAALLAAAPGMWSSTQPAGPAVSQDAPEAKQGQETIPVPLPKGKKLVLADGTFQLVREYSVQGDRVRYWSVERSDWEDIPTTLVNWDATHQAEAEQSRQDADLKAKIRASEIAERAKDIDVDRSLEIKPALFLPDGVGFYYLEGKLIYEMKQSLAVSKMSKARETERILTGVPLIPRKMTLEIADAHAALRLITAEPEFFMRPADQREPRFRLLRLQVKGDHRLVENISVHITGDQTHHAEDIDFQTWTPARGVFRYTVNQRLEPGEYAFVEMVGEEINSYVWDFGIDPPSTKSQK
jgi:flagellar motor protein MotB